MKWYLIYCALHLRERLKKFHFVIIKSELIGFDLLNCLNCLNIKSTTPTTQKLQEAESTVLLIVTACRIWKRARFHSCKINEWNKSLNDKAALFCFSVCFRSIVGTFLCGPEALGKVLEKKCAKYSDVDPRKTRFYFNKENFWAKKKK